MKTNKFPLAHKLHSFPITSPCFITLSGRYIMSFYRYTLLLALLCIVFPFSSATGHSHHDDNWDSAGSMSFILTPQVIWLDNGPLKDLVNKEPNLRDRPFQLRQRNPVFMLGFGSYHDHGNGLRTGVSFYGGYKSYHSLTFTGGVASALRDSVAMLRLIPAYGGFTFDKVCRLYDITLSAGIMIGGGVFVLNREFYDAEESGAFTGSSNDNSNNRGRDSSKTNRDWAFAGTVAFDVHTGVSFRLAPLLSLGIEASALCFYSPEGYGYATGEFFTINPGLRFIISIGRAG
jgi:hypothetical protein